MIALEYKLTKKLIFLVLDHADKDQVRIELHWQLQRVNSNEGQFYAGIIKHGPHMRLTSEQWFTLLSRLPIEILRSQLPLNKILSPRQLEELPPTIG